jgi:hypothetical protein
MKTNIELQAEYNLALEKIRLAELEKTKLIDEIKDNGYFILDGILQENKETYGYYYDLTFYSHFDGHTSDAIYRDESGSGEITKEFFDKLKTAVKNYKENSITDNELIEELDIRWFEYPDEIDNFWEHFTIKDEDEIYWEYSGSEDQGELCDGSYVSFRSGLTSFFI